jgi:hypothetical protein
MVWISRKGVASKLPFFRMRIYPACSIINIRPDPSPALVIKTGFVKPLAISWNEILPGSSGARDAGELPKVDLGTSFVDPYWEETGLFAKTVFGPVAITTNKLTDMMIANRRNNFIRIFADMLPLMYCYSLGDYTAF